MKNIRLLFSFSILAFLAETTLSQTIRYVTPAGAGTFDGSTWANAAPGGNLQTIINGSAANDQVWVACGTYVPTTGTNRGLSFNMRNGVAIYGSFAGSEMLLADRAFTCGPCSILSGEIGSAGVADNSYHVVSNAAGLSNSALLDGFIIEAANDNRAPTISNGLGGGVYNNGGNAGNVCSPSIRNCVIRDNFAQFGAGVFNSGHTGGTSSPAITNCIIVNNTAYIGGGGLDNFGLAGNANPILTNTLVYGNTAGQRAGGMYCWGGNNGNANPSVVNCVFANNSAIDGGGVVSDRENSPGGSFSGNSNPLISNSVFWGNTASGTGPQFFLIGSATFNATYSDIDVSNQSSPHLITGAGTGNLNANPLFINIASAIGTDNCWFTSDDGLSLQAASMLINAGNTSGAPSDDILGELRTGNPDLGAYEYQAPLPIELVAFSGLNKGTQHLLTWQTATESRNRHFALERSADLYRFETLATLEGMGHSSELVHYEFLDERPLPGMNYYRLLQVDVDGNSVYSKVLLMENKAASALFIYPNPASSELYIGGSTQESLGFQITDLTGQTLQRGIVSPGLPLDVSLLPPGIYLVRAGADTFRLVKQ